MTTKILVLMAATVLLSACATAIKSLPVCDGHHRRPANPRGSVLDPAAPPAAATAAPAPKPSVGGCGR